MVSAAVTSEGLRDTHHPKWVSPIGTILTGVSPVGTSGPSRGRSGGRRRPTVVQYPPGQGAASRSPARAASPPGPRRSASAACWRSRPSTYRSRASWTHRPARVASKGNRPTHVETTRSAASAGRDRECLQYSPRIPKLGSFVQFDRAQERYSVPTACHNAIPPRTSVDRPVAAVPTIRSGWFWRSWRRPMGCVMRASTSTAPVTCSRMPLPPFTSTTTMRPV